MPMLRLGMLYDEKIWWLQCPCCGTWTRLSYEQLHGAAPARCFNPRYCQWTETCDWSQSFREDAVQQGEFIKV